MGDLPCLNAYEALSRHFVDSSTQDTGNTTAVVLVNWTRGSELHFLLLLRDALEGVISRLVHTAGDLHPVISSIVGDITALGKPI